MADYDAIVVGAGLAGCTAAYCMAQKGMSVLLLERGNTIGAKNMTGGRLYAHSLERIMPGFSESAPVERKVVRENISMMTPDSAFTVNYRSRALSATPQSASYTVLRSTFDAWLGQKAEDAGCDVITAARVDTLLKDDKGAFIGVKAGDDELTADVTILADGVNSLLAQQTGLKKELLPHQVAVGAKEVIELPKGVIEDRFNLEDGEGVAWLFAGFPTQGAVGGGFLYTNRESISIGVVASLSSMRTSKERVPALLDAFTQHPEISHLLDGGRLAEYSGHLVPEAGLAMMPELTASGLMLVGDAAGLCMNLGFTVRGMDLAIGSGELAARAAVGAKEKGDFSKQSLDAYRRDLEDSFILQDLDTYRKAPDFIEKSTNVYGAYPVMIERLFTDMFTVDGKPSRKMWKKVRSAVTMSNLCGIAKDAVRAMGAI